MQQFLSSILVVISLTSFSQSNYYSTIDTTSTNCYDLKTDLHELINNHTVVSYAYLWNAYTFVDNKMNDANTVEIIWDMYSDNPYGPETEFELLTDQCGTYTSVGDCYNREHAFPKSWWGGSTTSTQYTDIFHVIPVDGYINGVRSNLPYAVVENGGEDYIFNNGTKKGASHINIPNYNGDVFEPIDEYKGDIARIYFYMATRYENEIASWETSQPTGNSVLDGSSTKVFEDWALNLYYQWHLQDPVSQKEIDRNNEIYTIQGNRNPFVDHPEFVSQIWFCDTPIPLNFIHFTAKQIENDVYLEWQVENVSNNAEFNIEVSANGLDFYPIATISTHQLTHYTYTHEYAFQQNNDELWYRIQQVDIDGGFSYSNIVNIIDNKSKNKIYPNPANTTEPVIIESNSLIKSVKIYNSIGNVVYTFTQAPANKIELQPYFLANGIYFIRLDNQNFVEKLIIQ